MLYLGLGSLLLAVVALVLGFAARVPGLGPLASVALLMAFVVSVAGVILGYGHDHIGRHSHR
jgi:hypothetical protein